MAVKAPALGQSGRGGRTVVRPRLSPGFEPQCGNGAYGIRPPRRPVVACVSASWAPGVSAPVSGVGRAGFPGRAE